MSSTEQFTEALQLTHSSQATVSNSERLSAERYLMDLRDSAEGLNLSFYIITNEPVNDLRYFWAFNAIKHHIPLIASTLNDQEAGELYRSLFSFIHRYLFASPSNTPADYVLNKHAQLMVVGLRHFFPNRWNNFFSDLFDFLERGRSAAPSTQDAAITYFLRIFEYIDEQVVNVRDQLDRGREQRSLDMQIKDAMRESVIPRAVQTWFSVLSESRSRAAETANLCLAVVQTYVDWIDVTLIITADWMNLLYFLVTMPAVRVAACECVHSLTNKKQLTGMKLASLAALNVVDTLPRLLSMLTVPPTTDEEAAFFDVVAHLSVSVSEQFLSLLETCCGQIQAQQQQQLGAGYGAQSPTGPVSTTTTTMTSSSCPDPNVVGGVVQDRPYQLNQTLIDQLSASLHGSVNQLLRLLRVAPDDSCDAILTFFQLYSKSSFMNDSETMQLLLVAFNMSKIRDLADDESRVWEDVVIDQRRTIHTLLRLLHRRAPSLVFEYAYNLVARLVLVWSQGASSPTLPINAVPRSGGSRLSTAGSTASTAAVANTHHSAASNNNNNNNNNNANNNLSTSASLRGFSEGDGYGGGSGSPDDSVDCGNGGLLLHQLGSGMEETQNFRDPSVVEAVLRFVYEVGESVRMDVLRDEHDAFTQMIAQIISCESLVGTDQTNSGVHLTFFELIDRYVLFFQYHKELLPVLLHRLLLLPGGVMNPNDRVRTRIDYLFSHLLQVLRLCLYPYAADMTSALQSILATTDYLLPNDRRQLFEAIGTLLSIALSPPGIATGNTHSTSNNNNNNNTASPNGTDAATVTSSSSSLAAALAATGRNTGESSGGRGGGVEDASQAEQQQYILSVMEGLVQPSIASTVQLLLYCDGGVGEGGACNGLCASPRMPAEVAVAESISYISAIAKGLNNNNNNSSGSGGNALSSSSPSLAAPGGSGSLQTSFQGANAAAALTAGSMTAFVNTLVAQRFGTVTEQVLRVLSQWQRYAVVRDAGSQFFQQMVNTIPYDLLEPYYEVFVEQSLTWMDAVSELSRLLRLMYQSVNKAGPRCISGVARLTPLIWQKTAQVGTLDDAAPVLYMGVLSETAREKVDVYRQFFTYIFNVATWGSAPGLLLLPHAYMGALVQQLLAATALPTELELPRAALQTLSKLTLELCGVSAVLAQELATRSAGFSPTNVAATTSATTAALADLVLAAADPAAMQTQLQESEMHVASFLLEKAVPSVLRVLIEPSFNLRDAKNLSVAIGETGQLCKMLIARLGEPAMQAIYNFLAPLVGNDEAMGFCTTLRDQPKLNSALKIKFREMLIRAQDQLTRRQAS